MIHDRNETKFPPSDCSFDLIDNTKSTTYKK